MSGIKIESDLPIIDTRGSVMRERLRDAQPPKEPHRLFKFRYVATCDQSQAHALGKPFSYEIPLDQEIAYKNYLRAIQSIVPPTEVIEKANLAHEVFTGNRDHELTYYIKSMTQMLNVQFEDVDGVWQLRRNRR